MATKHNTEINNEPLKREYFDDVLDLFYDINEKNEELYNEITEILTNLCTKYFGIDEDETEED